MAGIQCAVSFDRTGGRIQFCRLYPFGKCGTGIDRRGYHHLLQPFQKKGKECADLRCLGHFTISDPCCGQYALCDHWCIGKSVLKSGIRFVNNFDTARNSCYYFLRQKMHIYTE